MRFFLGLFRVQIGDFHKKKLEKWETRLVAQQSLMENLDESTSQEAIELWEVVAI